MIEAARRLSEVSIIQPSYSTKPLHLPGYKLDSIIPAHCLAADALCFLERRYAELPVLSLGNYDLNKLVLI